MRDRDFDAGFGRAVRNAPTPAENDAIRKGQESVRRHIPEGVSLVDELIEERRTENRNEAVRALQERARQLVRPGTLVSDELIKDRRDEASAE